MRAMTSGARSAQGEELCAYLQHFSILMAIELKMCLSLAPEVDYIMISYHNICI